MTSPISPPLTTPLPPALPAAKKSPPPPPEPASFAQLAASVILALGMSMLLFALWDSRAATVTQSTAREWRVLPSVSIYVLTAAMALCIQSAIPRERDVLWAGVLALAASIGLQTLRVEPPVRNSSVERRVFKPDAPTPAAETARTALPVPATMFHFLGFEAALFSALLIGTWLGRGMREPRHFILFVLCAVSGNAWLAAVGLGHDPNATGTIGLLSVPWPSGGPSNFCPTVFELLVLCTVLEGARVLRLHRVSMFLGAAAGYCGGAFLALEPWPAWPVPGVMMCASGMLVASWPDLRITRRDVLTSILTSLILMTALLGLTLLRQHLVPEQEAVPDVFRYRGST